MAISGISEASTPDAVSMLCAVFTRLAVLQTQEYDNHSDNARSFVRYGN